MPSVLHCFWLPAVSVFCRFDLDRFRVQVMVGGTTSFPFFCSLLFVLSLRTLSSGLPPARCGASGCTFRLMAFVLGAIGLSIHRPSRGLTCSPLSAGGRVSHRLLKGPPCRVRCFGFTRLRILLAPSVASILTWPTHPTLPLLLSRALRRSSRQLFRWVWVSLSLAFLRFFSFFVPRPPLLGLPRPSGRFRIQRRHNNAWYDDARYTCILDSTAAWVTATWTVRPLCT